MLDVSRVISGKLRLALQPVDLNALLSESVETLRPVIDKGEIEIDIEAPRTVDSIAADPDRMRQVIENLLLNAVKFTPKGGRITVRLSGNTDNATIAVSDNGEGIRSDLVPHVFERFRQSNATPARLGGLGLGLAIVQHLVKLHGGTVNAASPGEGQGATFTVTLPTHLTTAAPTGDG